MNLAEPQHLDLPTPSGPMRTAIYRPAAEGRYPGLVFFSEIFQVTAPIRRTAALLAGHGFVVAVPEVYHEFLPAGTALPYDEAGGKRGGELKTAKELGAFDADARVALDHLASRGDCTGRLGAMGFCLGGHLAFRAAMDPRVRATACFYATNIHNRGLGKGANDNSLDRVAEIKGEIMMMWGKQDGAIPREGRQVIYNAMTDAGVTFTWHEFNGQHAFMRDEGPRYDAELAQTCYGLVIGLFRRALSNGIGG